MTRRHVPTRNEAALLGVLLDRTEPARTYVLARDARVYIPKGGLYTTLRRMQGKGWITATEEPYGRAYTITDLGRRALEARALLVVP